MNQSRREFGKTLAGGALAVGAASCATLSTTTTKPTLAVSTASYMVRQRFSRRKNLPNNVPVFHGPLHFIDHCHQLGASGVQISVRDWDRDRLAHAVRERMESYGMSLEGQISLPNTREDLEQFVQQVRSAKEAGVTVFRSVALGGRRYETFKSMAQWREFVSHSKQRIAWAEPIMRRQGVRLALENHKDWRIDEMLKLLREFDSEHVGVNLDTGNNISLLDDPMQTVSALAPYTITTHLKDMGVAEYEDGFLLAEVPLGEGFLDIHRMVQTCRRVNPKVQFNLEMITRDPLKIPCLTDRYWTTWNNPSERALSRAMDMVRNNSSTKPLQGISQLDPKGQVAAEEENNSRSFTWFHSIFG